MTIERPKPRFVRPKRLKDGTLAYFFEIPSYYRKLGCDVPSEPLGTDYATACGADGEGGKAATLNALFDEWNGKRSGIPLPTIARFGSVDWLFREYKRADAYLEKVSPRSRPDYERTMLLVAGIVTKKGDRVGDRSVKAISPVSTDKIYNLVIKGKKGLRLRQGEKAIKLCSKAWRVVRRLYPDQFNKDIPDPWAGVALKRRKKKTKPAVTRDQVYRFAWNCIDLNEPEAAAAAVICFEWLQRPENVLAGCIRWTDYRSREHPNGIQIEHHKTGVQVWHPLEDAAEDGALIKFYEDAEAILEKLPRRGIPMILRDVKPSKDEDANASKLYSFSGFEKKIQTLRKKIEGTPSFFTLDACRHGGMTELEEAGLTDGQGRALSAHSSKAYDGYAKRTEKRALAATRKRHAHVIADKQRTEFRNGGRNAFRNDVPAPSENIANSLKRKS